MRGLRTLIAAAMLAALFSTSAATPPDAPDSETALRDFLHEVERVLPVSWRVVESGVGRVPIGWTGPEAGLYVKVEDTSTRFLHPNGFHYYSFYRIWLMPSDWEGEMRHTPYVADSAPAFLLGLGGGHMSLYHTAGGNVWSEGPAVFCSALGLDTISYTDLTRRVVDLEIEERLTKSALPEDRAKGHTPASATPSADAPLFEMSPYRIVGLAGDGPGLYLEYVFGNESGPDESQLSDLTEQLAVSVFDRFPEVESLYLRRCTRDTFTDTILSRD